MAALTERAQASGISAARGTERCLSLPTSVVQIVGWAAMKNKQQHHQVRGLVFEISMS